MNIYVCVLKHTRVWLLTQTNFHKRECSFDLFILKLACFSANHRDLEVRTFNQYSRSMAKHHVLLCLISHKLIFTPPCPLPPRPTPLCPMSPHPTTSHNIPPHPTRSHHIQPWAAEVLKGKCAEELDESGTVARFEQCLQETRRDQHTLGDASSREGGQPETCTAYPWGSGRRRNTSSTHKKTLRRSFQT